MDIEVAEWLAELIHQAVMDRKRGIGLTIEVDDQPANWLQIVPEAEDQGDLTGFLMNFPYRSAQHNPLEHLSEAGLKPPPSTQVITWESGAYATLWLRPDTPLVPMALFAADILEKIGDALPSYEVSVQMIHGL
jgi:hypothetical protein